MTSQMPDFKARAAAMTTQLGPAISSVPNSKAIVSSGTLEIASNLAEAYQLGYLAALADNQAKT